jgi:hypothetical protein
VGPETRTWLWIALLAAVALGVAWVAGRRTSDGGPATSVGPVAAIAAVLLTSLVTVASVQLAPPVADAAVSRGEWTFVRQSVGGLVSRETACGIPAATPALRERAPSVSVPPRGSGGAIAGHSMVYTFAPCHRVMAQDAGAWQVPSVVLGELREGQRRVGIEYELVPLGCLPASGGEEPPCVSELRADGRPLSRVETRWTTGGRD